MISEPSVREILAIYGRHGWILRRVLLSAESKIALAASLGSLFGRVAIIASEFDALWFSRSSRLESEAWEIRHLSQTPFALIEVIDTEFTSDERNDALKLLEIKMAEIVKSRKAL